MTMNDPHLETAIDAARVFLEIVAPHIEWDDEHFARTPERFATMLMELTDAPEEDLDFTTFAAESADEMIVIRDISFHALCSHHVVPFFGVAHIAYIPGTKIAGLSKFARAVRWWSRGLWVQEKLTNEIADYLVEQLSDKLPNGKHDEEIEIPPVGVGVIMEAEHLCMSIRGVHAPGVKTVTSAMRGAFLDKSNPAARDEFLRLIDK